MEVAEFWKGRETLQKALIILGGTTDLALAQLVLVGNHHTDATHQVYFQQFINRDAQPGDVVLVESVPRGVQIDPSYIHTRAITVPVEVWGWDDMESNQAIKSYFAQAVTLHEMITDDMPAADKQAIISRINRLVKNIDSADIQRNQSLWIAIVAARRTHPAARIFVRAGDKHLADAALLKKLANQPYAAVTFKRLDQKTTVQEDFQEAIRYHLRNR
jgi:hypothetical protein